MAGQTISSLKNKNPPFRHSILSERKLIISDIVQLQTRQFYKLAHSSLEEGLPPAPIEVTGPPPSCLEGQSRKVIDRHCAKDPSNMQEAKDESWRSMENVVCE
ncbi:hypothetical protein CDAR_541841 [Caerostris darwini]|uniref:Uncharacterized protein n=1 Tax=Caerostris darwini TaxID=1538125 RepID=A0AAV4UUS2_9ARAC|nr:hypothetical protein CDAR_541841 [Caerostris darwini]